MSGSHSSFSSKKGRSRKKLGLPMKNPLADIFRISKQNPNLSQNQNPKHDPKHEGPKQLSPLMSMRRDSMAHGVKKFAGGGQAKAGPTASNPMGQIADDPDEGMAHMGQNPMASVMNEQRNEQRVDSASGSTKTSDSATGAGQTGPGGQAGQAGQGGLSSKMAEYQAKQNRTKTAKEGLIQSAIERLQKQREGGISAQELLRLSAAFAAPTKTGSIFETIGRAGTVGADMLDKRAAIDDQIVKLGLAKEDLSEKALKDQTEYERAIRKDEREDAKERREIEAAAGPASNFGKIAKDEGLKPGTPEFNARVAELNQMDLDVKREKAAGPQAGQFDKKTGNYIATNGTVIKASEVKADREYREAMVKLQDAIRPLTPQLIKKAGGWDWTTGDISKFIAGKIDPKQLAAQTAINAASLQERLKNLPPGPASDKDIAQAKSSFPGFSDPGALQAWIDLANRGIQEAFRNQEIKYGDVQWFGAGKTPGEVTPEKKPEAKEAKPESKPGTKDAAKPTPKVGTVYKGREYIGGDPDEAANWRPIKK